MYKIGSLFDGSGGFPLAGTLCGIEPAWASEVEPYPIAVTRSRFPKMRHLGDISKVNGAEIEPVDIITFGSPCQDLSVAGKQAGIKHADNGDEETTRSGLFMEAVRIIKEMRSATNGKHPSFALWENVPGAFSSNKGEDFRIVLEELVKIVEPSASMPDVPAGGWAYADSFVGDGWSLAWRVFDAQYWGVPQRRRRIHLVLDLTGERARSVLFEREGVRGYFAPGGATWQDAPADAQGSLGADDRAGEGFDGYNGDLTGGVSATLGVNCGVSTGRNGVIEYRDGRGRQLDGLTYPEIAQTLTARADGSPQPDKGNGAPIVAVGLDGYNQAVTGEVTKPLTSSASDTDHIPAVVTPQLFENHSQDSRYRGPFDVCPVLPAQLGTGGNNQPFVVEPACIPIHDQATRFSGKRGDKADGKGNGLGVGQEGDPMNTLTSGDRHAVVYAVDQGGGKSACNVHEDTSPTLTCTHGGAPATVYALDRAAFNQGANAQYDPEISDSGVNSTIVARGPSAVAYWDGGQVSGTLTARNAGGCQRMPDKDNFVAVVEGKPRYIVRRLMPTECARLQGFPDWWGDVEAVDRFEQRDYLFWLDVRNTHAAINGKAVKDYTVKQMLTWYNKLHTDSAEYKMWGNGIALPPALYVMQGIRDALDAQEDDAWML